MKKYIIFDFDGTIARTLDISVRIINDLAPKFKSRLVNEEDILVFKNEGWRAALKRLKISPLRVPRLAVIVQKELNKHIDDALPEPGLIEILERIRKQGLKLGILTSNSKENVEAFLVKNEMKMFDFIYADRNLFGKDKVIKKMLKEQKIEKDDIIYIGDETRDFEACKKVGIEMIGVSWGFNSKEILEKVGVVKIVDKPSDLFEKIWDQE